MPSSMLSDVRYRGPAPVHRRRHRQQSTCRFRDKDGSAWVASGRLAHLAIYCGWPTAVAALDDYDQVYTARKVDTAAPRAVAARFQVPPQTQPGPRR